MNNITDSTRPAAVSPDYQETSGQRIRRQDKTEAAKEAERTGQNAAPIPEGGPSTPDTDQYIHGAPSVPSGLYQLTADEKGNPKVVFDAPDSEVPNSEAPNSVVPDSVAPDTEAPESAEAPENGEDKKGETLCTVNTDQVDAEIKQLKQKKTTLESQIAKSDDPSEQQKLKNQLSQLDSELQAKDNDTYRRQHAQYTNSESN